MDTSSAWLAENVAHVLVERLVLVAENENALASVAVVKQHYYCYPWRLRRGDGVVFDLRALGEWKVVMVVD